MIKELDKVFEKTGLYKASYIYIYSDFRIFFENNKVNPEKKVSSFLNLFLNKGITCIIPAFSYTTNGEFHIENTKSKVGFLANYVMKNYQFERSEHPIFSYVAIGKKRKIVKSVGKSAFGKKSVHSRLLNKNTFFLNFFRPLEKGNTLIHHIEQIEKVNYRYDKKFSTIVFKKKKKLGSNFKAYVRKFINKKEHRFTFKKIIKRLIKEKFMIKVYVKNSHIFIYNYDFFYKYLRAALQKDRYIFINK